MFLRTASIHSYLPNPPGEALIRWHVCAFTPNWVRFSPRAGYCLPLHTAPISQSRGLRAPITVIPTSKVVEV